MLTQHLLIYTSVESVMLNFLDSLLVSMAPLSNEIRPVTSSKPQHIGPAIPEVCTFERVLHSVSAYFNIHVHVLYFTSR